MPISAVSPLGHCYCTSSLVKPRIPTNSLKCSFLSPITRNPLLSHTKTPLAFTTCTGRSKKFSLAIVAMSTEAGVGVMGTKLGMMSFFEPNGTVVPVTVVGFREGNIVTQIKTQATDGYDSVQVGYRRVRDKKLTKPELGHLEKSGIIPMRHLQEFRLQNIDGFEVGQKLVLEELFKEGDLVDVSGTTIGKGFQGGIKRHNFKRGQMTHGSKSHRALGSIGAGTTPGRVYKGKKMPGRMGGTKTKIRKLRIVKIDNDLRVVMIKGALREGGLPASPCIRFNKEGALLAVSTNDNSIKILANPDGVRLLRTVENRTFDASRAASASVVKAPAVSNFASINSTVGTSILDRAASVTPVAGINSDSRNLVDVKPRIADEPVEASRTWKLTEINEPSQCRSLRLPDNLTAMRVSRLIYTNSGLAILALASNAVHKLWKWQRTERNPNGKATASIVPQLWQPSSGMLMTNDISDANPEDAVPCFALSKNDSYVMSASGGKISLFNMMTFKTMTTFMPPPPAATFLAFHPQDNNIIAIGMEDSSIQIYNVRVDEVKSKLKGHQKKITGLAFSNSLNVLISSGADAQLCVWSTDLWERQASKFLPVPPGRGSASLSDTRVQFHLDQTHLLAVHESQIAIYEAPKLECLKQWFPREATVPITYATYSCDSQSIYVSFEDGGVVVLTASTLRLRCRINPTAYLPPNPSLRVYPLVIAAHPSEPNQFALGLTDGGIHVLEPLETEGKWGTSPPVENGAGPSTTSGAAGSEQAQR